MTKFTDKKYVCISGFNVKQDNRGNAALSYGTISFLLEKGWLRPGQELVQFMYFRNPFNAKCLRRRKETIRIAGHDWILHIIPVVAVERWLMMHFGMLLPFTPHGRMLKDVAYEAADYGGDGFSDIYGERLYYGRMYQTTPFMAYKIPLIMLPQTIGPFQNPRCEDYALQVLKYADHVFVRDGNYNDRLDQENIPYEHARDLSAYMEPEPWDIDVPAGSVGINVSGLAYSNRFKGLEGQFDAYPQLIDSLIKHYRKHGRDVFLIPHSYNYHHPSETNDDLTACRQAYARLEDKTGVQLIDRDMTSPQVKYLISRMSMFIGTRMHANFAAIYTGVPVFGLAYSYKFSGAFDANGLDGQRQTQTINYLPETDIPMVIDKIDRYFESVTQNR